MDPNQPSYEYAPLNPMNAIRILTLLPASTYSAKLQVRLVHTRSLQPLGRYEEPIPTPYEAVSYAWGAANFSHPLECDGYIMKITVSVDNLLRRLRRPDRSRSLWLDSICIDQKDEDEKSIQVRMMDQIYSRAHKVHIWLGESTAHDRIEWVFRFFREMAVSIPDDGKILEWYAGMGPWENDLERTVDRFLTRPWFGRRWILQEVVLAHDITVRCGPYKMPWKWLSQGSRVLNSHLTKRDFLDITARRSLETIASLNTPPNQLLDLMFEFHRSECFDPRDRIFALYGMATVNKDVPVDYGISWTKVYLSFAGVCIKAGHFLTLLQHVTTFGSLGEKSTKEPLEEDSSMPSWVPNWKSARFSAKRFSLNSPQTPSQNCDLIPRATDKVFSDDTLRKVFRDFKAQAQFNNPEYGCHVRGAASYGVRTASTMSCMDIALLFLRCRHCMRVEESLRPERLLAQVLSAAIMDTCLHFDRREAVLESLDRYSQVVVPQSAAFNAPDLAAGDERYKSGLGIFERTIENAIRDAVQASANLTEAEIQENFQSERMARVAKLLKHHSLFYTQRGPLCMPGISPSPIEDGDHVLIPQSKEGEITPTTTAFLMRRLVGNEHDAHFKIVGLCFVAEPRSLDELDDSVGRRSGTFVIA